MIAACDECGEVTEVLYYPQYEHKWLCENDFALYEQETERQWQ